MHKYCEVSDTKLVIDWIYYCLKLVCQSESNKHHAKTKDQTMLHRDEQITKETWNATMIYVKKHLFRLKGENTDLFWSFMSLVLEGLK